MSHMWGWKGSINRTEVQFVEGAAREERKEMKEGNGRKKERKKEEKGKSTAFFLKFSGVQRTRE